MILRTLKAAALATAIAAPASAADWNVQSTFPMSLPQIGTLGTWISERLSEVSDGELNLEFQNPGAIVPALEAFDAVQTGAVEAGWSTSGYWAGKIPALQMFGSVPFGPEAGEYLAWYYFGGGKELYNEIYHSRGIHGVICAVFPPEASGWFKEEITSVEDLKGLKMRFFGLGAKVMEKMGVQTQLIAGGDLYPALELGTIDATEFSMPAIDQGLGLYQVAKHYYFPGWHQQSTLFELIINKSFWDGLTDQQRAMVDTVCEAAVTRSLAEGEALQFKALAEMQAKGVNIHRWPDEILDAFEVAWTEVVTELAQDDPEFAKVWESFRAFREDYKLWGNLGYLPKD